MRSCVRFSSRLQRRGVLQSCCGTTRVSYLSSGPSRTATKAWGRWLAVGSVGVGGAALVGCSTVFASNDGVRAHDSNGDDAVAHNHNRTNDAHTPNMLQAHRLTPTLAIMEANAARVLELTQAEMKAQRRKRPAPAFWRCVSLLMDTCIYWGANALLWVFGWEVPPLAWAFGSLGFGLARDLLGGGRSIGKRLLGLEVIDKGSQSPASVDALVVRNVPTCTYWVGGTALAHFLGGLNPFWLRYGPFLWANTFILFSRHSQSFGDKLAGTMVTYEDIHY